jgi:cyclin B
LKADAEKHTLAKYFMELMLPDYGCLAFPPSMRAAAALCLAMKITDNTPWVSLYNSLRHCMF